MRLFAKERRRLFVGHDIDELDDVPLLAEYKKNEVPMEFGSIMSLDKKNERELMDEHPLDTHFLKGKILSFVDNASLHTAETVGVTKSFDSSGSKVYSVVSKEPTLEWFELGSLKSSDAETTGEFSLNCSTSADFSSCAPPSCAPPSSAHVNDIETTPTPSSCDSISSISSESKFSALLSCAESLSSISDLSIGSERISHESSSGYESSVSSISSVSSLTSDSEYNEEDRSEQIVFPKSMFFEQALALSSSKLDVSQTMPENKHDADSDKERPSTCVEVDDNIGKLNHVHTKYCVPKSACDSESNVEDSEDPSEGEIFPMALSSGRALVLSSSTLETPCNMSGHEHVAEGETRGKEKNSASLYEELPHPKDMRSLNVERNFNDKLKNIHEKQRVPTSLCVSGYNEEDSLEAWLEESILPMLSSRMHEDILSMSGDGYVVEAECQGNEETSAILPLEVPRPDQKILQSSGGKEDKHKPLHQELLQPKEGNPERVEGKEEGPSPLHQQMPQPKETKTKISKRVNVTRIKCDELNPTCSNEATILQKRLVNNVDEAQYREENKKDISNLSKIYINGRYYDVLSSDCVLDWNTSSQLLDERDCSQGLNGSSECTKDKIHHFVGVSNEDKEDMIETESGIQQRLSMMSKCSSD